MFVKLYEVLAQGRRGYSIQYNPAMQDCCAGAVLAFRASQAALNSAFAVSRSLAEPMGSPPGRWTVTLQSQTHRTVRFTLVGVVFVHHENAQLLNAIQKRPPGQLNPLWGCG